jgi:hypothetical protein
MFMGLIAACIARAYPDLGRETISKRWLVPLRSASDAPADQGKPIVPPLTAAIL